MKAQLLRLNQLELAVCTDMMGAAIHQDHSWLQIRWPNNCVSEATVSCSLTQLLPLPPLLLSCPVDSALAITFTLASPLTAFFPATGLLVHTLSSLVEIIAIFFNWSPSLLFLNALHSVTGYQDMFFELKYS